MTKNSENDNKQKTPIPASSDSALISHVKKDVNPPVNKEPVPSKSDPELISKQIHREPVGKNIKK